MSGLGKKMDVSNVTGFVAHSAHASSNLQKDTCFNTQLDLNKAVKKTKATGNLYSIINLWMLI